MHGEQAQEVLAQQRLAADEHDQPSVRRCPPAALQCRRVDAGGGAGHVDRTGGTAVAARPTGPDEQRIGARSHRHDAVPAAPAGTYSARVAGRLAGVTVDVGVLGFADLQPLERALLLAHVRGEGVDQAFRR